MSGRRGAWRALLLVASSAALHACADVPAGGTPPAAQGEALPHSTLDPQMAEAVFRYQFSNNARPLRSDVSVICIGYWGSGQASEPYDPPASFLRRFADVGTPVKAYSQCSLSDDRGIVDTSSGAMGIVFHIVSANCQGQRCEVEGGWYKASEASEGHRYVVQRNDGAWIVTRDEVLSVS